MVNRTLIDVRRKTLSFMAGKMRQFTLQKTKGFP